MKLLMMATALAGAWTSILGISAGQAQTSSGQSNYVFRFNTGISSVFLNDMTFKSEQPLNLGSCTTTEKVNGPLACAVNCQNQSVCLLSLSGPSNSTVNDVLEIVEETPVLGTSTPTASASPAASPSASPSGIPSGFGRLIAGPAGGASNLSARIRAYNTD